jgi:hypothetical protein
MAKNIKQLTEKIESDANDIRTKYPEIAKMTVAEIVATKEFSKQLRKVIEKYDNDYNKVALTHPHGNSSGFYAYKSLSLNGLLKPEKFIPEYIACMDKESSMAVAKRMVLLQIGNEAYRRTVLEMMKQYDNQKVNKDESK